jgi:hypothetical protein
VNCDDGDAYTTDECDPGIGCINATCPVDVFDFSDGVDGWDLGAGGTWVWDESGWLQGFGSTATLKSPDFSGSSSKLRIRYKCKDGSGGLVFDPGPEMPCKSIGEWEQEYVDLGGATWKVHVAHKAPGAILLDRIEVLKECQ